MGIEGGEDAFAFKVKGRVGGIEEFLLRRVSVARERRVGRVRTL
jgi:hypothetical protein